MGLEAIAKNYVEAVHRRVHRVTELLLDFANLPVKLRDNHCGQRKTHACWDLNARMRGE
jgi:hypothetical protein